LAEDLKAHKDDREAAKSSLAEANALRAKQADEFAGRKAELSSNVGALEKAIAALDKGAAGGFLQTGAAQALRKLVTAQQDMIDMDRQTVLAFLSGGQTSDYSPQSGQISGILKQMHDEMTGGLAADEAAEETAIKEHAALVEAKNKEIAALTQAIETKTVRSGEVAVNVVNMKNDLADTAEALEKDKAFLKELETGCSTKEAEWNERQKVRAEELLALADTIKLLSDDDALELFKKAVPTKTAFVQLTGQSAAQMRARALASVHQVRRSPAVDLIAMALHGKTAGFEKVQAMIDEMIQVLATEQGDDDKKKDYCAQEFDSSDDKKKGLERSISDADVAVANAQEGIATLTEELKALASGIEKLDKSVAEATEQRKQEHADYTELMALDTQAKELLGIAKNRLNKFYNPKLYVPPPKKELSREDRISENFGVSTQTAEERAADEAFANSPRGRAFVQHADAPPPPPETFDAYAKKSEESTGVIAMVDLLIKDLDTEMTEAETSEKDAQKDYETMLADAKSKRAADSKSVAEKEGAKADLEQELQAHKNAKAAATKELAATAEYISGLHGECDWLHEHYEVRKAARAGEVESLKNAKAVLAGADYSLVQVHDNTKKRLRG